MNYSTIQHRFANKQAGKYGCIKSGNVLLRLNLKRTHVETSKNVRIPIESCKKFWPTIQRWHEKPQAFKPVEFNTCGCGKYTITSYEDDILTAGCHKIAYAEMEQVMNLVNSL